MLVSVCSNIALPARARRRDVLRWTCAGAAAVVGAARAQAPAWPNRPVRLIIPSIAGSPWDPMARHLADRLAQKFGQPFVVDNRGGATGLIGMDLVAKATDGHTLGVMFMPHALLPALHARMPYDTLGDLAPVAQTQWTYNVLVTRPSMGVDSVRALVDKVRANPGKFSYSSGGNGSPAHVMGESFKQLTGTYILHVPYRGPVAALQDLVGGQSDLMFASVAAAVPHVQSGRLKALAVTSREPLEALPGVPTFAAQGFANFDVRDWAGIVASRSVPAERIGPLNEAIVQALAEPGVPERFARMGTYLQTGSAEQFQALIRAELPKWAEVVRRAGIRLE
ncbi:Bug family tripartite tricarboxylate transporter substrate binding protein [Pseudacidovorax intermedius]|uniref:Bug family tripartite tricarboxylate transporter substrate binding protein n=1 Tax=Pseudacidovorax intermedius TaxID=433924 RepID=UPI00034BDF6E|nr:tripartite tricarboxylate transporter substrate binding protein [Pseudacidovorax intermedius]